MDQPILFFDGVCVLCSSSVEFVFRMDRKRKFLYAPLQGNTADRYLSDMSPDDRMQGMALLEGGRILRGYDALMRTAAILFPLLSIPIFFLARPPLSWAGKLIYRITAKNRYSWFGQKSQCKIPLKEESQFYLD